MSAALAQVYDTAAELVGTDGGWFQLCDGGANGRFCMITAIHAAAVQLDAPVADIYGPIYPLLGNPVDEDGLARGEQCIGEWNDALDRTQAEVVAKLHEAAEIQRREVAS